VKRRFTQHALGYFATVFVHRYRRVASITVAECKAAMCVDHDGMPADPGKRQRTVMTERLDKRCSIKGGNFNG